MAEGKEQSRKPEKAKSDTHLSSVQAWSVPSKERQVNAARGRLVSCINEFGFYSKCSSSDMVIYKRKN